MYICTYFILNVYSTNIWVCFMRWEAKTSNAGVPLQLHWGSLLYLADPYFYHPILQFNIIVPLSSELLSPSTHHIKFNPQQDARGMKTRGKDYFRNISRDTFIMKPLPPLPYLLASPKHFHRFFLDWGWEEVFLVNAIEGQIDSKLDGVWPFRILHW